MAELKYSSYSKDIFTSTPKNSIKFFIEGRVGDEIVEQLIDSENYGTTGDEYEIQSLQRDIPIPSDRTFTVKYIMVPYKSLDGTDRKEYLSQAKALTFSYLISDATTVILDFDVNLSEESEVNGMFLYEVVGESGKIDASNLPYLKSTKLYDIFRDYDCDVPGAGVTFTPYYNFSFNNDDYNPIMNNYEGNRVSTIAELVETFEDNGVLVERVVSGTYAEMVDSFYSEQSNVLPRYVGCRKGFLDIFTGNKKEYVEKSIEIVQSSSISGSTGVGLEQPFASFTSFTGSIFPQETSIDALKDMSVSEMDFTILRFVPNCTVDSVDSENIKYISTTSLYSKESLPSEHDVIYTINFGSGSLNQRRVVNSTVYVKDSGKALYVNAIGVVTGSVSIRQE